MIYLLLGSRQGIFQITSNKEAQLFSLYVYYGNLVSFS